MEKIRRPIRSPILILAFNRPELTRKLFNEVLKARPRKLYVVVDGPRENYSADFHSCAEVRDIFNNVNWPCELKTLFRSRNLGCKLGVAGGINWFFQHEPEGIILEDDIIPDYTFFEFCDELLEKYRDNESVGSISGSNLVANVLDVDTSYIFTPYTFIWGWATWRRAWSLYDLKMKDLNKWLDSGNLERMSNGNILFERHWKKVFLAAATGRINTWDYQWLFSCWNHRLLTAIPQNNLTSNVGFGLIDSTHTKWDAPEYLVKNPIRSLVFPIKFCQRVEEHQDAKKLIDAHVFYLNLNKIFLNLKNRLLRKLFSLVSEKIR